MQAIPTASSPRDRQQKPTVRSLKLGDRAQVALDKPTDWQPEAVSVLKPVVAPGEISEPQALDGVQIRRKLGLSDLRHARKFRSARH
jgi:hypothetical protein